MLGNGLNFHFDALNYAVLTQNCRHVFTRGTNRDLTLPLAVTHTRSLFTRKAIMQLHCSGFRIWTGLFPSTNCICFLYVFSEVPTLWFMNELLVVHLLVVYVEQLWLSLVPAASIGIWLVTEKAWGPVEAAGNKGAQIIQTLHPGIAAALEPRC